jgi:signal transduction histidine kinase
MKKKPTILIIDDQEPNRILLYDMMINMNYQPILAENGIIALELLKRLKPDTIILDIMMPLMNGFEVLAQLVKDESLRYIPVIIVSALNDTDSITQGIQLGAEDFLARPFNPVILKTRIESCLAKKTLHELEAQRRTQLEKELEEAQIQLLDSDRLSGLGQVSASIAHDLNNKIAAIINRVGILTRKGELLDEKTSRNLAKIEDISNGAARLLRHLLDYSRGDKTEFETVDIHTPIENAMTLVEHKLTTSRIEIEFHRFTEVLNMIGNSDQLEQLFMNLFINAGDAMDHGGKLSVSASKDRGISEISIGKNESDYIQIDVTDTGEGIPVEIQEKIFLLFFTTKPKGKGTGLGMFIVKQIVDAHSGKISIASEKGKGTTITLLFSLQSPIVFSQ